MTINIYGTSGAFEDFITLNGISLKPSNRYDRKRKKTLERSRKRGKKKIQKGCED